MDPFSKIRWKKSVSSSKLKENKVESLEEKKNLNEGNPEFHKNVSSTSYSVESCSDKCKNRKQIEFTEMYPDENKLRKEIWDEKSYSENKSKSQYFNENKVTTVGFEPASSSRDCRQLPCWWCEVLFYQWWYYTDEWITWNMSISDKKYSNPIPG